MNSQDYVSSTIEAPVRSLDDRPEEELVKSGPITGPSRIRMQSVLSKGEPMRPPPRLRP